MKKKVIQFFVLVVSLVILMGALHFLHFGGLTGFAIFTDSSQVDFDGGSYVNTTYNGSAIVLVGGNLSGSYTSQIFDAGNDATWNELSWEGGEPSAEVLFAVDGGGDVFKSLNLAITWSQTADNYGRTSDTIEMFADSEFFYIISTSNKEVWRSSDGIIWVVVNNTFADSRLLLGESNLDGGLFAADASGDVYMSQDDGVTWTLKGDFNGGATNNGKGMGLSNGGIIYIVDGSGAVWRSDDSGVTWTEQNSGYGGGAGTDDLEVDSSGDLYILNNNVVLKSTDEGVNWVEVEDDFSPYSNEGCKMLIDSDDGFYIADCSGRAFSSVDSGVTWVERGDVNLGASANIKGIAGFSQATDLSFFVRSCDDSSCSGESWVVASGNPEDLSLDDNQYFQYKVDFTGIGSTSSYLESVEIDYDLVDPDSPLISFGAETTSEGSHKADAINVDIDLSDASQIYSFINFDNSLVGFWKMNESLGDVIDYSGNGNDGGVAGGSSYAVDGMFGNAMSFDGGGDYVDFGDVEELEFKKDEDFSISFWVKRSGLSTVTYPGLVGKGGYKSSSIGWKIFISSDDNLGFYICDGTTRTIGASVSDVFADLNEWHHVVLLANRDGSAQFYVDGESAGVSNYIGNQNVNLASTEVLTIASYSAGIDTFNGTIDEVLIFSGLLSGGEISALYNASSYSRNFTGLGVGEYDFYAYTQDIYGNEAQTSNRIVTLTSNVAPSLTLVKPGEGDSYGTNESLDLEFSVSDSDGNLDSCWYNVDEGENVSLADCANTTFDVSGDGSYGLNIYANDTDGEETSDSAGFTVAVGAPAISLSSPAKGVYLSSGENIEFVYTATDVDLDSCELWIDDGLNWGANQTDSSVVSGVEDSFSLDLDDGDYIWNIWCNDSLGNNVFNGNRSLYVDSVAPVLSLTQPTGTKMSRTVGLVFNVAEENSDSCWFNVYRGASLEIGNTSVNCSLGTGSFDVTVDANFVLNFYANDSAGNGGNASSSFSVDTSITPPPVDNGGGGGGGGGIVPTSNTTTRAIKVDFSSTGDVLLKRGTSEKINLVVTSKDFEFLNNCGLKFGGKIGGWFSNSQSKGLNKGEKFTYVVDLNVPVSAEPGLYNSDVVLKCDEGSATTSLKVTTYRNNFEAEILDYERAGEELRVRYSLEEYAGEDHKVLIDYSMTDFDGVTRVSGQEVIVLGAKDKVENVLIVKLPKDSFGEFNFVMSLSDGVSLVSTEKEIFLPSGNVGGFAIFEGADPRLSWIGIVVVLLIIFVFVGRFIWRHHKRSRRGKSRGRKLIELDL